MQRYHYREITKPAQVRENQPDQEAKYQVNAPVKMYFEE